MTSGTIWTPLELAYVDGFVRAGVHASRCLHLFPGRSKDAVVSKFCQHRRNLGLPIPSKEHLAPRPAPPPRDRRKPALIFSTALEPEPKPITEFTTEADGCQRLLRRHLETGAHWLSNERFAVACKQAGLAKGEGHA